MRGPSAEGGAQLSPQFASRRAAIRRRLLILAVGLGLAGCAAIEERSSHGLALPARFEGASASGPGPLARWWTRFGSAELNGLVARAEAGNLDIAAAITRIEQADAQARVAGAALLPSLVLAADASRAQSSGTLGGGVRPASQRTFLSGTLAASFELDVWGRNRDLLRAALAQGQAARYEHDVVRISTQGAVANAWLLAAAARDRLAIAERNLANAERVERVVRERLAQGTGTALDLAQQESLVAIQRTALPTLRQDAAAARTALALLVGEAPQGFRVSTPSLASLAAPSIRPGLPSAVLVSRPDIRAAEARLAAADANVMAARKALLPAVQLGGQGGLQGAALATLVRPESLVWSLAAGLTQPIFDGGRLQAQTEQAAAERRELLESYRKSILSAFVDVENALTAMREGAAREAARRVAIARSREAFRFAEQRFREGTIDLQTLLNTQGTLFQAEDSLVQDRLARLQAAVSLFVALGGGVT